MSNNIRPVHSVLEAPIFWLLFSIVLISCEHRSQVRQEGELKLVIPEGNLSGIHKVKFFHAGKNLATLGNDKRFQIWNAENGKLYFSLDQVSEFSISDKLSLAVLVVDSIYLVLNTSTFVVTDSIKENKADQKRSMQEFGYYEIPTISIEESSQIIQIRNYWNEIHRYSIYDKTFMEPRIDHSPRLPGKKEVLTAGSLKLYESKIDSNRNLFTLTRSSERPIWSDTVDVWGPEFFLSNNAKFLYFREHLTSSSTSPTQIIDTETGASTPINSSVDEVAFSPSENYLIRHSGSYYLPSGETGGGTKIQRTKDWSIVYESESASSALIDDQTLIEAYPEEIRLVNFQSRDIKKSIRVPLGEYSFIVDYTIKKAFVTNTISNTYEILSLTDLKRVAIESQSSPIMGVHADERTDSLFIHHPLFTRKVKIDGLGSTFYKREDTTTILGLIKPEWIGKYLYIYPYLYNSTNLKPLATKPTYSNSRLKSRKYIVTDSLQLFEFSTKQIIWSPKSQPWKMLAVGTSEKYAIALDSTRFAIIETRTGQTIKINRHSIKLETTDDNLIFDDKEGLLFYFTITTKNEFLIRTRLNIYNIKLNQLDKSIQGPFSFFFDYDRTNNLLIYELEQEKGVGLQIYDLHKRIITFTYPGTYIADYSPFTQRITVTGYDTCNFIASIHLPQLIQKRFNIDYKVISTNSKENKILVSQERSRRDFAIELDAETGNEIDIGYMPYDIKNSLYVNDSTIFIATSNRMKLFKINRKTRKVTESPDYIPFGSSDYIVLHSSGLFDGTPDAISKLYFTVGGDIIELGQLKERYYEPNLWKKVMNGEKLREVTAFNSVELPPDIQLSKVDGEGNLPITLTNREAGIGKVAVFINGKEIIADARRSESDVSKKTLSLSVSIKDHPYLLPGQDNLIEVRAWNGGGWIVSRPASITYVATKVKGTRGAEVDEVVANKEAVVPNIYILASGVSDYSGDAIDLKYAAKDAENFSSSLAIGAKRMFGTDKSFVYLMNGSNNTAPSKANIVSTFKDIASKATSSDIFVVYLSGHGINWGGHEGDFYYLTSDAYSTVLDAYNDPAIRTNATLSSKELVDLFKTVPALKQVLIIDACASGRMVDNLIGKRDISSSTLRALDKMKDRTGMHIITGCSADAVSYEASRYGQGVLTYSLIEAIKGAKLYEGKYIDIIQLFQYAKDRVPELAKGIGGIQSPQIFSPNGSNTFYVGEMQPEDKEKVVLAKTRPLYTRSMLLNKNELTDDLNLSKSLDHELNEISSKGEASKIIFMDIDEFPDACKVTGFYEMRGGKYFASLKRSCGGQATAFQLEANTKDALIESIRKRIE